MLKTLLMRYPIVISFLLITTLFLSIGIIPDTDNSEENPDVLLIMLETARADHFSCYGYERNTTPHMCEIAEEDGVIFEKAYSQGSMTSLSVPSFLTSETPNKVGSSEWEPIPEDKETVSEVLQREGYRTRGNYHVGVEGLDWFRGIEHIYHTEYLSGTIDPNPANLSSDEHEVNESVQISDNLDFLDQIFSEDDPDFIWHFSRQKVHGPWIPESQDRKWSNESFESDRTESTEDLLQWQSSEKHDFDTLSDFYDGEIRTADRKIGEIRDYLEKKDRYEDTMIIITSDHGEAFGQHDRPYHGWEPYEHQIHVPLIIKFPDNQYSGTEVEEPVRLVDVVPTIYDYISIQEVPEAEGESLLPILDDESERLNNTVFAAGARGGGEESGPWGIRRDDYKYILKNPYENCIDNSRSDQELYHLPSDPDETEDISSENSDKASSLNNELCGFFEEGLNITEEETSEELSEGARKRLEALGYLS